MKSCIRSAVLAAAIASTLLYAACNTSASSSNIEGHPDAGPSITGPAIDDFTTFAAKHVCGALFRCCNEQSLIDYFSPWANSQKVPAADKQLLPPKATLDQAGCEEVLPRLMEITPFADWVRLARSNDLTYVPEAAAACAVALDDAKCGDELGRALYDGTCFGFSAPIGGTQQRKCFKRSKDVGAPCSKIVDGFGAGFYGDCDPTKEFCCYVPAGGTPGQCEFNISLPGTCAPAAALNESCEYAIPPLKLCVTGLDCVDGTCVDLSNQPDLQVNDPCFDADNNPLGECKDSWCDFTSKTCAPRKANNQNCQSSEECQSLACLDGICVDAYFCLGQ